MNRTSAPRELAELARAGGLAVLLVAAGCETNPNTGHSQLLMMPVSEEMQMGVQAYAQVKSDPQMKPSTDPREIEPVKRVAARVIEAVNGQSMLN